MSLRNITLVLALWLPLLNLVGLNLAWDSDGSCPYPCNQPPSGYPLYGYPPPPPSPSGYPLYLPPPPPPPPQPQPRPHCPPIPTECCNQPPPPYPYIFPPPAGTYGTLGGGGGSCTTASPRTVRVYVMMLVFLYAAFVL